MELPEHLCCCHRNFPQGLLSQNEFEATSQTERNQTLIHYVMPQMGRRGAQHVPSCGCKFDVEVVRMKYVSYYLSESNLHCGVCFST